MNTIQEALKDMRNDKLEESVSSGGWIINEEDDILDPFINENKLSEGISAVDWSSITPCDILYCETSVQHAWESSKRRPLVVMYKGGTSKSPSVYGMQITTTSPSTGFRSKFKYKLQDWRQIGLRAESYINYDHLVHNVTNDVRKTNNSTITKRDAKGLLGDIKKNYGDLVRLGYSNSVDRELLDDFISYLETI